MKKLNKKAALVVIGGIMIISGILVGEPETVFHKAAMICLECIGIG